MRPMGISKKFLVAFAAGVSLAGWANPSGVFWTRAYPGIYYHSAGHPGVINSTLK